MAVKPAKLTEEQWKERRRKQRAFLKKQGTSVTPKDPVDMSQKELSAYKKKVMKRGAILAAELATAGTGAGVVGKRAAAKAAQNKKFLAQLNRRQKEITEKIQKRIKAKAAAERGKEAMSTYKKATTKKALQKHMELKRAAAKAKSKTKPSTTKTKRSQAKKSPTVDMRKASPHTKYKEAKSLAKREGHEGTVAGARVTAKGVKRPTVKATTKTGKSLRTKGPGGKTKELTKRQRESVKPGIKADIKKKRTADRDREIHKKGRKSLKKAEQTKRDPFTSARAKTKLKPGTKDTARKASPSKSTKGQLEQPGGRRRIATSPMAQRKITMARLERAKDKGKLDADGEKLLRLLKRSVKRSVRKPKKGGPKKK